MRDIFISEKYWHWFRIYVPWETFCWRTFDDLSNNFSKNSIKTPLETISAILNRKYL
jgi:hypothetical protein